MNARHCLAVALGSALGAVLRQGVSDLHGAFGLLAFPWDTLTVNVIGSLVIGWLAALTSSGGRLPTRPSVRQFLMGGVCGGFTTFSVFSLETLDLLLAGNWAHAAANMGATLILCLTLVWVGHTLALRMLQRDVAAR